MRFRCSTIIISLLVAISAPALASAPAPVDVKAYLAQRRASSTSIPLDTLRTNASSYIGKVFEVRGTVSGFSKNSSGYSIIINTPNNGSFIVSADSLPFENPGMAIACLVKIGEESTHSLSDIRLVAWTYEADVSRLEQAAQIKAAQAKSHQAEAAQAQQTTAATAQQDKGKAVDTQQIVTAYKNAIRQFNKKLTDKQADTITRSILGFSYHYRIDPRLVCAVILAESHFRLSATSKCGAQGLGQLMPGTAAGMGVNNAYDPVQNVYGSVRYIRSMLDRVSGNKRWESLSWYDLAKAIAAYNAGPGAVKKHGGIPPYKETQNYVRRVTSIYKQLCGVK